MDSVQCTLCIVRRIVLQCIMYIAHIFNKVYFSKINLISSDIVKKIELVFKTDIHICVYTHI